MNINDTATAMRGIGQVLSHVTTPGPQPEIARRLDTVLVPMREAASAPFGPMSVYATDIFPKAVEHAEIALKLLDGSTPPGDGVTAAAAALTELGQSYAFLTDPQAHEMDLGQDAPFADS